MYEGRERLTSCVADVLEGAQVFIKGLPITNATYDNSTGNYTIEFYPPSQFNFTGYMNLSIVNPDGGWTEAVDVMYFTEDCPFVGTSLHFALFTTN